MIGTMRQYAYSHPSFDDRLGKVPGHWRSTSLGAIATRKSTRNRPDMPLLSVLREKGVVLRSSLSQEENHNFIPDDLSNYLVANEGDLVVNKMKAWQGSVGIAPQDGIVSPAYYVFDLADIQKKYAHRLLRSRLYADFFGRASDGVRIGQWDLRIPAMKRIPVLIPPPDEQDSIARYLDEMDRHIARFIRNRRRLIEVLNEQKQAIINRAVTSGLDHDVPLKPSGIDWLGDIPKHWGRRRIKQVSKLLRGKFSYRPRNDPSLYNGPYPFIQTGDVSRAEKKVVSYSQTLNEKGFAVSKQFPSGTLCMTIAANIGDVAILDFEACFPDSIIGLAPNKGIFTEYLYYVMRAMKPQLVSIAPVTAQGNLNVERVGAMSFALPPIYEQEAIAEYIVEATRSIDYTIRTATREINLISEYRTCLISDVVTGKIDVRHLAPSVGSEDLEEAMEVLEPLEDVMADVEMDDKEDFNESD